MVDNASERVYVRVVAVPSPAKVSLWWREFWAMWDGFESDRIAWIADEAGVAPSH